MHLRLYFILLFTAFSLLLPKNTLAQCEDVTVEGLTNPGPFEVGVLTEDDGIRNSPDYFGATVYYPINATPPFPSIAIVPGFTALPSSVEEWGPFYASHGIVTIIIGTNSIFDGPELRAYALIDALETIRQENVRVNSPLENQLDIDKFAVSGWSMGGGGAQRAAVLDSSIKGVVALCPWLLSPSLDHQSPVLIISGQNDQVAPPNVHADIHYNTTPDTTPKLLFEVINGDHSVANSPNGGNGMVGEIALSWLKLYVNDDDCYCPLLTDSLLLDSPDASQILFNFECESLSIEENSIRTLVYPNPTNKILNVNILKPTNYVIYGVQGQKLASGILNLNKNQIEFSNFTKGIYYLRLNNETIKIIRN